MVAVNDNEAPRPDPLRPPFEGPEIDIINVPNGPDVQPVLPNPVPQPPPPIIPDLPSLEPPERPRPQHDDA